MQWYYADQGQKKGPVEESTLDELVLAGVVRDDTLVWNEGMQSWQPHGSVRVPTSAPAVPPAGSSDARYCGECGRPFPANELVSIGVVSVCATCKPIYLQRLREGSGGPAVGAWRYGGFWIRLFARLIDAILINVVFIIVRIPFGMSVFGPTIGANARVAAAALSAMVFVTLMSVVAAACYEIFFIAARGATLGKLIFGLRVIRADGSKVSLGVSAGRYFAQIISSITLGIGYIMAAFDDQKRTLHDRICDTRVIYSK
jgi:uncharacterized RDD family membrane protein YckC